MPLGIEIANDVIRTVGSGNESQLRGTNYGVVGLIPKRNEPIVWNNPKALRDSGIGRFLSASNLWNKFQKNHKATTTWRDSEGIDHTDLNPRFIAEAIAQLAPEAENIRAILAIDNTMSEFHQETLLATFRSKGYINVELLWRPICIALNHLEAYGRGKYSEGDKLLIVDLDTYKPEYTVLELKLQKPQGELVPLRTIPSKDEKELKTKYCVRKLKKTFLKTLTQGNKVILDQLDAGAFSNGFHEFLETGIAEKEVWIRNGLEYTKFPLDTDWLNSLRKMEVKGEGFQQVESEVRRIQKKQGIKHVVWNGFPARLQKQSEYKDHDFLANADSVANGAAEYGRRRSADLPTYLDTLPGLKVLSLEKKSGRYKFFDVILAGEVEGGQIVRIPETITKFSLEEGIPDFTAVLLAEDIYKKSTTPLPQIEYKGNVPLLLSAEMRPAHGHAVVTIEGRGGYEDVFGRQRKITLDWNKMIDIPDPIVEQYVYTGPDVYPVRGRIADDADSLSIAKAFASGKYNVGSQFDYPCGRVGYLRIHEPWGYKNPCGHIIRTAQRALFGAFEEKDPEIHELAKAIGKIINNTVKNPGDRHRYLNYMFRYAPEKFREELRGLFRSEQPTFTVNAVYAVGRTFYRHEDFEIFLDYFLDISKQVGYPEYPSDRYTPAYFWSFFRALCYYKDTALVDSSKVEDVLKCICNYATQCSENGWPGGRRSNVIKYLLFGILFSIRLREHNHDFLSIDSPLYNGIVEVIKEQTPQIPYPVAMMAEQLPGKLNDYVLRFVNDVQTKEDLEALQGLVVE